MQLHALLTGPFDTPYEGGFFYFLIRCPPDYPIRAPRVRLMTTGNGQYVSTPTSTKMEKSVSVFWGRCHCDCYAHPQCCGIDVDYQPLHCGVDVHILGQV